jgi:hypothetical protein
VLLPALPIVPLKFSILENLIKKLIKKSLSFQNFRLRFSPRCGRMQIEKDCRFDKRSFLNKGETADLAKGGFFICACP